MSMVLVACDDVLDTKPYDKFDESVVWGSKANAEAFIFQTYADVMGLYTGNGAISVTEAWTPNSVSMDGINGSANNVYRELISKDYDAGFNQFGKIRRCNLIIKKVQESQMSESEKLQLVSEAKFLRAMVNFYVARRMGKIVWVDKVYTEEDANNLELPTVSSVAESYKYIVQDLDDAISGLPEKSLAGRVNKYVAAAFKTEICLQAAAYTGNKDYFQQVVDAAQMVIPQYSLESDYEGMFNEKKPYSPEIIFAVYMSKKNTTCQGTIMQNMMPNINNEKIDKYGGSPRLNSETVFEGWLEHAPSQNLVDDYLVIDANDPSKALRWNETSQFNANVVKSTSGLGDDEVEAGSVKTNVRLNDIIYQNRDKRFYASIVSDSSSWFGETITTCINGNLSRWAKLKGSAYYLMYSNYYWRKAIYNINPRVFWDIPCDYHYVLMRLGRVYLNLAEAYLNQGKIKEAVDAINQTRTVHGGLPVSTAASSADAWTDYKRERRVDLALEGDYYWSLLRWGKYGGDANYGRNPSGKIKELDEVKPLYIDITKNRKSYIIGVVTQNQLNERRFDESRRYLFPIPYGEILRNKNLVQNEGW